MKANIIVEPVEDCFLVTYPYCGEAVEIYLEPDVEESLARAPRYSYCRCPGSSR